DRALWAAVRTWLKVVEETTGRKPVLYISQTFVNKHLPHAPDLKRDYPVWIARYGEYKPDVRLLYWQLSPDGRVSGIRGEVDISVFNGYGKEFDLFKAACQ
ncbi:MAG: GH25 family lysozyme, partial [Prevotella sp.]